MSRIKKDATGLAAQMAQAITQVALEEAGGDWPPTAPTSAELTTARNNIVASDTDTNAKKVAWQAAAELKGERVDIGFELMERTVDQATAKYGAESAMINAFGVPPEGAEMPPLHKLIEIVLRGGPVPGSLFFDFENIKGCSYEIQWSETPDFAVVTGSATASGKSEYVIGGLTPGTQYWARVRPHRGSQTAEWSDPATHIAPV